MPIVTIETLKTYFLNGRHPNQYSYEDLIDTLAAQSPLTMYGDYKTNSSWLETSGSHSVGVHTLTKAMFGYSDKAKALYGRLQVQGFLSETSVGLLNSATITGRAPLRLTTLNKASAFGIWPLTTVGGNFYCRVESSVSIVHIELWGEFV